MSHAKNLHSSALFRLLVMSVILAACNLRPSQADDAVNGATTDTKSEPESVDNAQVFDEPAIKRIDRTNLVEIKTSQPFPSRVIDVNPPNFIWVGESGKRDKNAFYQVRLSETKSFVGPSVVMSRPIQRFCHNFHEVLKPGTYYWQYGKVIGNRAHWRTPIEFQVTGNERQFPAPRIDVILGNLPTSYPRLLANKEMIGNYVREDLRTELGVDAYVRNVEKHLLGGKLPESLIFGDEAAMAKIRPENLNRYMQKRTKDLYRSALSRFTETLRAYILTGDKKFFKESVRRYEYLDQQYRLIDKAGYNSDFTRGFFKEINALSFDVLHDYLAEDKLAEIQELLVHAQRKDYASFRYNLELALHADHAWQHHLRNFLEVSLILQGDVPEADEWIDYVYHLWLAKGPTGSRNDGGWFPGNGYFDANHETVFLLPYWFSKYSDFDFYTQPWHQNTAKYLFYSSPVGHVAGGFGDGAETSIAPKGAFAAAINLATVSPYAKAYLEIAKSIGNDSGRLAFRKKFDWYVIRLLNKKRSKTPPLEHIPMSMDFRDVGLVGVQSDPRHPNQNWSIVFRSSPFGTYNHAHPAQNAFNIQYGGIPVFFRTGYYSSWADSHSLQSYSHTRAHNSVLADGIGHTKTSDGYGWIPQHVGGDKMAYFSGDASSAYSGSVMPDGYRAMAAKWNVPVTPANGFGDPGVTKFRRHCVFVKPSTFVVYDELEADKPVEWTWLLHSRDTLENDSGRITVHTSNAAAVLDLFSNEELQKNITDEFHGKAEDFIGNGAKKGIEYVNQFHLHAKTTRKTKAARFIGIIQVTGFASPAIEAVQVNGDRNTWTVGSTVVRAELSPDKPASLVVVNEAENAGVAAGNDVNQLQLGGKRYKGSAPGVSVLVEGVTRKDAIDVLPDVMKAR